MAIIKALSVLLLGSSRDLLTAYDEVWLVKVALLQVRANVESAFKESFAEMEEMDLLAGSGIGIPCHAKSGRHRRATCPVTLHRRTGDVQFYGISTTCSQS